MLFISEDEVREILTMEQAIVTVREAFQAFSNRQLEVSQRVTMQVRGENNSCIFLPACYLSMPFFGIKYASSFHDNIKKGKKTVISQITLYSADTGEPLCIVSSDYLTAVKTGAAAAVATDLLANKGECSLALIGSGVQAETQLMAISMVRDLKEVRIFDIDHRRAELFASRIANIKNISFEINAQQNVNKCIENADIISTCTFSSTPVFSGENITCGTHINAIGSFTPTMQEIDCETIIRANKIVTDNIEETWSVSGDLQVPYMRGEITKSKIYGELGDIVSRKIPGREKEDEITIYESVGFGALDIAVAISVYKKSVAQGDGSVEPIFLDI